MNPVTLVCFKWILRTVFGSDQMLFPRKQSSLYCASQPLPTISQYINPTWVWRPVCSRLFQVCEPRVELQRQGSFLFVRSFAWGAEKACLEHRNIILLRGSARLNIEDFASRLNCSFTRKSLNFPNFFKILWSGISLIYLPRMRIEWIPCATMRVVKMLFNIKI